ncbi:hypothetical protein DID88_005256 [Monilinia fructigena]|uniref:Major facilitator superfamily (MFS) profile domain-containing protein n=1 Tax=Monilinia fructigena TaxID=38457 RepID=A0A395J0G4_9HELO|nr:hypothetical protein DID88_005256 [Monilinia fructigena]
MVLSNFGFWFLASSAIVSCQPANKDNPLMKMLSCPQVLDCQKLSDEWTSGVVDTFNNHGAVLKEFAETTYLQMPSEFRNEIEKIHAQIYEITWRDLSIDIQNWIQEHPYQTAFYVVNGIVFFAPATSSGPILWALGFTSKGPRAGKWVILKGVWCLPFLLASFASMLQRNFGVVGAKSLFAYVQSANMGGYGSGFVNVAVRLGAATSSLVYGVLGAGGASRNSTAS